MRAIRLIAFTIVIVIAFTIDGLCQAPGTLATDILWRQGDAAAIAAPPTYGVYAANIYYYFSFDETGDVVRKDSARNRLLTPYNGVLDTTGIQGKAVKFDNLQVDHLAAADSVYTQPDSMMFISFWFRSYANTTQCPHVHGQHYGCGNTLKVSFLSLVASGSYITRICDSTDANFQFPYAIRIGEWYHVAMLLLPQKDSIYVWLNDTLRLIGTFPSMKRLGKMYVGASGNPLYMFSFFGAIDELMCIVLPVNTAYTPRKSVVDYLYNSKLGRKYHEVRDYLKP